MQPDRRLRAVRLAAAMKRLGIVRDEGVAWGRPRVANDGAVAGSLFESFLAGDRIAAIAKAWELPREQVENVIRFFGLFPKCDLPSFWNDPKTRDYRRHL